jgi:multicomponent Na+:H+ antiporter subunit F
MSHVFFGAACLVLVTVAVGLVRVLSGPGDVDRMMAAQLLGTGGVGVLLLLGAAPDEPAAVDVALATALLASFSSVAFVMSFGESREPDEANDG